MATATTNSYETPTGVATTPDGPTATTRYFRESRCFFWSTCLVIIPACVILSTIFYPIKDNHFVEFCLAFTLLFLSLQAGYSYGKRNDRVDVIVSGSAEQCVGMVNICFENHKARAATFMSISADDQKEFIKFGKAAFLEYMQDQWSNWSSRFSRRGTYVQNAWLITISYFSFRLAVAQLMVAGGLVAQALVWTRVLVAFPVLFLAGRRTYEQTEMGRVARNIRTRCQEPRLDTEKGNAQWTMDWWAEALCPLDI